MNEAEILLSRLAIDQIAQLHPTTPRVPQTDYEDYRLVIAKGYRAIYRYFPESHQVCIHLLCIAYTPTLTAFGIFAIPVV